MVHSGKSPLYCIVENMPKEPDEIRVYYQIKLRFMQELLLREKNV